MHSEAEISGLPRKLIRCSQGDTGHGQEHPVPGVVEHGKRPDRSVPLHEANELLDLRRRQSLAAEHIYVRPLARGLRTRRTPILEASWAFLDAWHLGVDGKQQDLPGAESTLGRVSNQATGTGCTGQKQRCGRSNWLFSKSAVAPDGETMRAATICLLCSRTLAKAAK